MNGHGLQEHRQGNHFYYTTQYYAKSLYLMPVQPTVPWTRWEPWIAARENRDFPLNLAPIRGSQRIQGWRIFNFLSSLDPKSEICHILKFLGVKVAYDLFYGPKTKKIVIFP